VFALAMPPAWWLVDYLRWHPLWFQAALALAATAVLFVISYWVFGLYLVQQRLLSRLTAGRLNIVA
jgi:hypothetical protein